jgi:hypothetical protein
MSTQQWNATNLHSYGPPVPLPAPQSPGRMLVSPSHTLPHPYSSPLNLTRRPLTPKEKSAYAVNPITAVGHHFILDSDSADPLPYKVVGLRVSEGTVIYEVLLAGCSHMEDLEREEVKSMMDASIILE